MPRAPRSEIAPSLANFSALNESISARREPSHQDARSFANFIANEPLFRALMMSLGPQSDVQPQPPVQAPNPEPADANQRPSRQANQRQRSIGRVENKQVELILNPLKRGGRGGRGGRGKSK